jgi:hypothetical protein
MHHAELPKESELLFINAMTWGACGASSFYFAKLCPEFQRIERVFDRKDTTFPFTDRQCQRLVQIYETLKGQHYSYGTSVAGSAYYQVY